MAARAGRRDGDKAQGSAGRPAVSTGSCCRRSQLLGLVLRKEGEVRAESKADQWSPTSPALPGVLRALGGDAPPALAARGAPSRWGPDPASEEFAATPGFPAPKPDLPGPMGWGGNCRLFFLFFLFVPSRVVGGKRSEYLKLQGMADGAEASPRAQHARIARRRY